MKNITKNELIYLIDSTWNREQLEYKLKEKEYTYESFFYDLFKIKDAQQKQSQFLKRHFILEKDIEIINRLDELSLINFIKAYIISLKEYYYPEEMYSKTKDFLCKINVNVLNTILPIISRRPNSARWFNQYVLEPLITEINDERFKILCPCYMECIYNETKKKKEENYGFELLEKIKQVSEEKYKIFIEYVQDKCIRSINNGIDSDLFDASWMNQVIDRLISDKNISGLINLLDYKVVWNDHKSQDIPLNAENIRNILNALLQNKFDLFEYIKTNSKIREYLRLLTKKDNTLLEIFINFYNYREGENYYLEYVLYEEHLIEKEETLNYLVSKAKESNNLDSISKYIERLKYHENNYKRTIMQYSSKEELDKANEVLSRIENAIIELEQHYIKVFSKDNEAQQEYCSYSKKNPHYMY